MKLKLQFGCPVQLSLPLLLFASDIINLAPCQKQQATSHLTTYNMWRFVLGNQLGSNIAWLDADRLAPSAVWSLATRGHKAFVLPDFTKPKI